MIHDVLDLDVDASEVSAERRLGHTASTTRRRRWVCPSTLVEAYVSAAQKIARLALGRADPPR
jgi:hypothetical protein